MEGIGRDPVKQAMIEATLQSIKGKANKFYKNEANRILAGTYRTNRTLKNRNRSSLQKKKSELTRKLAKGKSGQPKSNVDKIAKIDTLLPILENETNIENANENNNSNNNSSNNSNNNGLVSKAALPAPETMTSVLEEVVATPAPILEVPAPIPAAPLPEVPVQEEPALGPEATVQEAQTPVQGATVQEAQTTVQEELQTDGDCTELFDPCTREPIENNDMSILEKRIREIKRKKQQEITGVQQFPEEVRTRLDLLLFILNSPEKPNETLLQYNNNGQLYESYWDIVFSLGLIKDFPVTNDFYMYNGKIEALETINESDEFMNNPLTYLSSKNINEGSKSGASDITFLYKKKSTNLDIDICSADPLINPSDSCIPTVTSEGGTPSTVPEFYFCSSKFFTNDAKKGVDKFDIQNIYTAAKNLQQTYKRKIILLVKDKSAVEEKLRKAIRKYISDEASYVYGMNELFSSLTELYDFVHTKNSSESKLTKEDLIHVLSLESAPKPILKLRLHQYIATYKICDAIRSFKATRNSNKFLVGIVPRGGKTYIAGGIINELNPKRVVVLLGAKSETLSQFKKDLFETFQNFNDYECIDVVKEMTDFMLDPAKKYIFIMSVELYKNPETARMLVQDLKAGVNRADLFICDEAHLKQTTMKAVKEMAAGTMGAGEPKVKAKVEEVEEADVSDQVEETQLTELDKQFQADVPVVYMTGTYIKPLTAFNIPSENVVIWDYQDIQNAKELATNEEYFIENFGELYERAISTCQKYGETYNSIQDQYRKFPELYLLTTQFTPDAKEAFLKQTVGGFPTIPHFFEVKKDFEPSITPPERWYAGFTNPKGVIRLLNYLAPTNKQQSSIDGEEIDNISSVMNTIDDIAQRIGDRLGFFTKEFVAHSQLWFLPHMQGHPLYKRFCALVGCIFQLEWFRKYFEVIAVSSSVKWNIPGSNKNSISIQAADGSDSCGTFSWTCPNTSKSLKECLVDYEANARSRGKGVIILAQNMLHLGISLPCVDIVVLLDSGEKMDERIQKMYRALTESTNKKGGYIVDMNYFRTVTAIMNYQIKAEQTRRKTVTNEDIPKLFNKVLDIFSIDIDKPVFGTREERQSGNSEIQKTTIPELQKFFKSGSKSGDGLILEDAASQMNTNIRDTLTSSYSGSYEEFLGKLNEEAKKVLKIRQEGCDVSAAERVEGGESKNDVCEEEEFYDNPNLLTGQTEQQKKEAFIDIFKTTLRLAAFSSDSLNVKSLEEQLTVNQEMRETLYDTLIKRGNIIENIEEPENQKNFIIDILIRPGLRKIIEENKNASYTKMKDAVEDDEKYPKDVESVLNYIKDHLAPKSAERHKYGEVFTPMSLVNEMLDTLPSEVWNNKALTWLDPANGMGNYPIAVFLRLYYGFRTKDKKYIGITSEGEGDFNPGLTVAIKDDKTRREHIVKNMLFMVELNSKNIAVSNLLFRKLAPGIKPNIIQMNRKDGFLADVEMKFPNGTVNEFDIIMGNPPYNSGKITRTKTRKTRNEDKILGHDDIKHGTPWIDFIKKIFLKNILKDNGYLLFITPSNWFHPESTGVRELLLSKQINFLRIIFKDQSQKVFGGSGKVTVGYYLIENKEPYKFTRIIDILNNKDSIKLNKDSIIILAYNSIYNKVCNKSTLFMNTNSIKSTAVKKCEKGDNKQIIGIYESGDIKFIKTNEKHSLADIPKIIINGYASPRYYYDKAGEYGKFSKDGTNFIIVGDDLDKVKSYFDTKLSALLLKYIKYIQDKIDPKYYPDVRTIPLEKITDETLADYFGFTKEERDAINATVYPERQYKFKEVTCDELKREIEPLQGGTRRFTRKIRRQTHRK
jgi:hypothetical protein